MVKRRATNKLNYENWEKEDSDPEDQCDTSVMKSTEESRNMSVAGTRKIAVAKRSLGPSAKTATKAVFSSFSGFKRSTVAPQQMVFSTEIGSNNSSLSTANALITSTPLSVHSVDSTELDTTEMAEDSSQQDTLDRDDPMTPKPLPNVQHEQKKDEQDVLPTKRQKVAVEDSAEDVPNEEYKAELKLLNESVIAWCAQNIGESPYVDLIPVFDDYRKHMRELDEKYSNKTVDSSVPMTTTSVINKSTVSRDNNCGFGQAIGAKSDDKMLFGKATTAASEGKSAGPTFQFGVKQSSRDSNKTIDAVKKMGPDFFQKPPSLGPSLFGNDTSIGSSSTGTNQKSSQSGKSAPFFSPPSTDKKDSQKTALFTFGTTATESTTANHKNAGLTEEEETPYEPPTVELVETEEPGAFYSIKAKLFFVKNKAYVQKGVGTLYLKPLTSADNSKTQLLIRAGTATGNVLLNICLEGSMPTKRVGKNNVSLVCIPNPPLDPKQDHKGQEPATLLIRVKTAEEADILLDKLEQFKKATPIEQC